MNVHVMYASGGTPGRGAMRGSSVLAIAVALVGSVLGATGPAFAQRDPAPRSAAVGATLPFTSAEAESAATTGQKIGPDYAQGTLASEASGRQAVRLNAGQGVEFTLTSAANAVNVAYNVPDGQTGSLAIYVNGTKLAASLALTSRYSYVDTPGSPVPRRTTSSTTPVCCSAATCRPATR